MKLQNVLEDHAGLLNIIVDSEHPLEVKEAIENWLRTIRPGLVNQWDDDSNELGLKVWLPSAERLRLGRPQDKSRCLFVRPRSRDLLNMEADQEAEELADAILDVGDENESFQKIMAVWLSSFLLEKGVSLAKVAMKHQKTLERELKAILKRLPEDEMLAISAIGLFESFLEVQSELLSRPDWDMVEKDLETLAKKLDKKKNWKLLRAGSSLEDKKNGALYLLGQLKGASVFAENISKDETPEGAISSYLVLQSLRQRLKQWEADAHDRRPGPVVQEVFQGLTIPMLFLGEQDEVLQHNTAFVKLNLPPSRVMKLADMDQVTIRGQAWSVRRTELAGGTGDRLIYTCLPARSGVRSGTGVMGGQDLGIITSSIAHELNNPLAGLLTALDLMSMEDHWDAESLLQIKEMRQGATRCKQLVETFLGFSRVRTDAAPQADKGLLRLCTEQALHLQRFRMVESGLRLQLTMEQKHPYSYPLHGPSTTMAIYLVLGEFMTALHHFKLLESQTAKGMVIEGLLTEDADNFTLRFNGELPRALGLNSKLLQYLLEQERLSLDEPGPELRFTHQNVLI